MSTEAHQKCVAQSTSWVAEVDDQIVGFLCAESAAKDLHIWELAVRREWQGRGIGRRLMKTVLDHARQNGFVSVTLTTFRDVPWNEPFYRSLGFEIMDTEKIDSRLKQILDAEIQHGLPGNLRCVMQLIFHEYTSEKYLVDGFPFRRSLEESTPYSETPSPFPRIIHNTRGATNAQHP